MIWLFQFLIHDPRPNTTRWQRQSVRLNTRLCMMNNAPQVLFSHQRLVPHDIDISVVETVYDNKCEKVYETVYEVHIKFYQGNIYRREQSKSVNCWVKLQNISFFLIGPSSSWSAIQLDKDSCNCNSWEGSVLKCWIKCSLVVVSLALSFKNLLEFCLLSWSLTCIAGKVQSRVRDNLREEVQHLVRHRGGAEVRDHLRDHLRGEVRDCVRHRVRQGVQHRLRYHQWEEMRTQIWDCVWDSLQVLHVLIDNKITLWQLLKIG